MTAKPPIPDDYSLPKVVNGWVHDPESNKNGHVWTAEDEPSSVAVFDHFEEVAVKVMDGRVWGLESNVEIHRFEYEKSEGTVDEYIATKAEAAKIGIERALDWMRSNAPETWSNPDVNESVFDPPAGYELVFYELGTRSSLIYYHRNDESECSSLSNRRVPDEMTIDTCPYLVVHVWNGSGNATIAIAPWTRAHGPWNQGASEMHEVVDAPDECGLDVALTMARQYVREELGGGLETDTVGQSDLARWSA